MINTNKHVKINQSKNTLFDDSNWSYLGQIFFVPYLLTLRIRALRARTQRTRTQRTRTPRTRTWSRPETEKTIKFSIFQFYGTLNWTFRHIWPSTLISKGRSLLTFIRTDGLGLTSGTVHCWQEDRLAARSKADDPENLRRIVRFDSQDPLLASLSIVRFHQDRLPSPKDRLLWLKRSSAFGRTPLWIWDGRMMLVPK